MNEIQIQVKIPMLSYALNQIVRVRTDSNSVPNGPDGKFWRRRLKDAVDDGCCVILKQEGDK